MVVSFCFSFPLQVMLFFVKPFLKIWCHPKKLSLRVVCVCGGGKCGKTPNLKKLHFGWWVAYWREERSDMQALSGSFCLPSRHQGGVCLSCAASVGADLSDLRQAKGSDVCAGFGRQLCVRQRQGWVLGLWVSLFCIFCFFPLLSYPFDFCPFFMLASLFPSCWSGCCILD